MDFPHRPYRPVLVSVETVAALAEIHPESVVYMCEAGAYRWAWDFGTGDRREIRIWVGEVMSRSHAGLPLTDVLRRVIGHETEPLLRASTVCAMFAVPHPTIHRLVAAGQLRGPLDSNIQWITRASLQEFLTRRLLEPEPSLK